MKQVSSKPIILLVMAVVFILVSLPATSVEGVLEEKPQSTAPDPEQSTLNAARSELKKAFKNYRNGDMAATKHNLKLATDWLHKAAESSKTEKARQEAHKLAVEIDEFKGKIEQTSEQHENSLARYWHKITSIIKREADHLIHSYVELSTTETTLKHLLDAKMHLFVAEHDLIVSHEKEAAAGELSRVLDSLEEANQTSTPTLRGRITALRQRVRTLKDNIKPGSEGWRSDTAVHALDKAIKDLTEASQNASPTAKLKIESLLKDIQALRNDLEKSNIKNDYESAMAELVSIIKEL